MANQVFWVSLLTLLLAGYRLVVGLDAKLRSERFQKVEQRLEELSEVVQQNALKLAELVGKVDGA